MQTDAQDGAKALAGQVAEEEKGLVSRDVYAAAVNKLVERAQTSTYGGQAAAQVLLSCYNGYDFQANLTDLNNLDRSDFELAITVIRGRRDTCYEPHQVIDNGSEIFLQLREDWIHLHVAERGKVPCRTCDGEGKIDGKQCVRCEGSGQVHPTVLR
ncbi:DUF7673 family protein [Geomonas agri]|uniref:DUF7673 family protein n=1 Tax=Geomonas agri TaxID=2873702 RepID=UPI001CD1A920|nr:hypothetical protein [Geomonas agri]